MLFSTSATIIVVLRTVSGFSDILWMLFSTRNCSACQKNWKSHLQITTCTYKLYWPLQILGSHWVLGHRCQRTCLTCCTFVSPLNSVSNFIFLQCLLLVTVRLTASSLSLKIEETISLFLSTPRMSWVRSLLPMLYFVKESQPPLPREIPVSVEQLQEFLRQNTIGGYFTHTHYSKPSNAFNILPLQPMLCHFRQDQLRLGIHCSYQKYVQSWSRQQTSLTVRQNGIITSKLSRPNTSRTRITALHSKAKPSL